MRYREAATDMLELMKRTYEPKLKKVRLKEVKLDHLDRLEEEGFILAKDAKKILDSKMMKSGDVVVTFRVAGKYTLKKAALGCAFKGHDIMDKTIKKKNSGDWNYTHKLVKTGENKAITKITGDEYNQLEGLVGQLADNNEVKKILAENKTNEVDKVLEKNKTNEVKKVLEGVWGLEEITDNTDEKKRKLINKLYTVSDAIKKVEEKKYQELYTGDYDLHDLLVRRNQHWSRPLSGVDANSWIDRIARVFGAKPPTTRSGTQARAYKSKYSVVRHGPQTNFISYLLTEPKELGKLLPSEEIYEQIKKGQENENFLLPLEKSVTKIDVPILVLGPGSCARIARTVPEVYKLYTDIQEAPPLVPPYYFIQDMQEKCKDSGVVKSMRDVCLGALKRYSVKKDVSKSLDS